MMGSCARSDHLQVDETLESHDVGLDRARAVGKCAVDLFNGRTCAPHADIEESWRPEDMAA